MARPLKKGLDYFPLDCHIDSNLKMIKVEFGMKGYGIVICLWQQIYAEEGYYMTWNQEVALMFAAENRVNVNVVDEVIRACLKRDIFSEEMFNRYSILTSSGIQKRYFEMTARRFEQKFENRYLLLNAPKKQKNRVNVNNNSVNVSNNQQSKVKENKYIYSLTLNDGSEFEILNEDIELWRKAYPKIDIENQLLQMKSWIDANPQKRKTKRGIKKFITSWLSRSNDSCRKEVKKYELPTL